MITLTRKFYLTLLFCVTLNTALMCTFALKYLHVVNLPQPRCILRAEPAPIEAAPKVAGVEVWL